MSTLDAQRVHELRRGLTDAVQLCRVLGLIDRSTQRQAAGLLIRCPWHEERTPSCSVTRGPDGTVRVRCFACDASGDALTLIARAHGLDPRRDFRGVLAVAATIAGMHGMRAELDAPPERRTLDDDSFHALATELVDRCPLDAEPDVLGYLDRRGLVLIGAQARLFALPASERQGGLVADLARKFSPEALALAGIVRRDDGGRPKTDRFTWPRHRLGIPWRAADGRIQTLQRRILDDGDRKYVFPARRAPRFPFGAELLGGATTETVIAFCEGALDVLALRLLARRAGNDLIALGIPGVENWSAEWARLAKARGALVALDADAAGEAKRDDLVRDLFAGGATSVRRFRPKNGAKDWTALLEGHAA